MLTCKSLSWSNYLRIKLFNKDTGFVVLVSIIANMSPLSLTTSSTIVL